MKKLIFLSLLFTLIAFYTEAQNDTMCIMKNGLIVGTYNVNTDLDSIIFYVPTKGVFIDSRDGNIYKWVKIGDQTWMAENLKYFPSVVGPGTQSEITPYYYVNGYYGTVVADAKATDNYSTYGVLYNWPAAMNGASSSATNPSGVQGVCPDGWHLPSDAEWTQLFTNLGGEGVAGGKLKETGTTHFNAPNEGATNETGFTALPGGYLPYQFLSFIIVEYNGYFWSSTTENYDLYVIIHNIYYNSSSIGSFPYYKEAGISVRCVKN